jgi:hypothetical protein
MTVLACWLVLSGFASLALAKNIVVTTLTDTANPPFDANGPCGTGTVSDLPGVDGKVSLREAIIAANNTPGADMITFASGGTIGQLSTLPLLCGGQTHIKGGLNDDGTPAITLDGAALSFPAVGLGVISSHNTISGLQVQQFPFGIVIQAGGNFPLLGAAGRVEHNTVTNNILAASSFHGLVVLTGDAPGSVVAHTRIIQNRAIQNDFHGILVLTNLSGAGSDTQITHTTMTDNELRENGFFGIYVASFGDHNVLSHATFAQNIIASNGGGILVHGGFGGADYNTFDVDIKDNTVTDNGVFGIEVISGFDNSSYNDVTARIVGNTVEGGHQNQGIGAAAGIGTVSSETGTSNNNVLDLRIERNTVRNLTGEGMHIGAGAGSPDGRPNAEANGNQLRVSVVHNTVENNGAPGLELMAGDSGVANANTLEIHVAHNTVCHNAIPEVDILGEGSFSGDARFAPNVGTGNVLEGEIFQNTATTVTVQPGTSGNTADVKQFNNGPCL